VKRRVVIRHLEKQGCEFLREGGNHTIYVNRSKNKASSVPRHREINEFLVQKVCRDEVVDERKDGKPSQS
jgi:predicted RNA binding protein YcfA (HicA-like mRNA interferase family)